MKKIRLLLNMFDLYSSTTPIDWYKISVPVVWGAFILYILI